MGSKRPKMGSKRLLGSILEAPGLDFGASGPRFGRLQASIFKPPSQHASEKTIFLGCGEGFQRQAFLIVQDISGRLIVRASKKSKLCLRSFSLLGCIRWTANWISVSSRAFVRQDRGPKRDFLSAEPPAAYCPNIGTTLCRLARCSFQYAT